MIGPETDHRSRAQERKWGIGSSTLLLAAVLTPFGPVQSLAGGSLSNCETYARDYADAHMGNGDMLGDVVDGGMRGAVAGGEWAGPSGARRGARAGGALGVMDNLGSLPGGWQALYDMAYQMCINENSSANYRPNTLGNPNVGGGCRSSATTQPIPPLPDGTIRAQSGCR